MGKWWDGWEGWKPEDRTGFGQRTVAGTSPADVAAAKKKLDRGSRRGAKRCVAANGTVYDPAVAAQLGIKGELFQSRKEATMWLVRKDQEALGHIRHLRRQVRFSLQTRNPQGLMEHVAHYVADFVYEEPGSIDHTAPWKAVVEDCKPTRGGKVAFREDTYILKRKWFQAQYGIVIRES